MEWTDNHNHNHGTHGAGRRRWLREMLAQHSKTERNRSSDVRNEEESKRPAMNEEWRSEVTEKNEAVEERESMGSRRERQSQVANGVGLGIEDARTRVSDRKLRDVGFQEEQTVRQQSEVRRSESKLLHEGENFEQQLRKGRALFRNTGHPEFDSSHVEKQDAFAESKLLDGVHANWVGSEELEHHLKYNISDSEKANRLAIEFETQEQLKLALDGVEKKNEFLAKIRKADAVAKVAHQRAEEKAAEVFELLEKLRKNKLLGFEARAKIRRDMLGKQAETSKLREVAAVAKEDATLLKKHIIQQGLKPETFVSSAVVLSKDGQESKDEDTIGKQTSLLPSPLKRTQVEPNQEETAENPQSPSQVNEGDWNYYLREGFKLSHLDLHDRAQLRVDREAEVDKNRIVADEYEMQTIHKMNNRDSELEKMKIRLMKSVSRRDIETVPNKQSKRAAISTPSLPEVEVVAPVQDHVVALLHPRNVSEQDKTALTGTEDHINGVYSGLSKETAPPFCEDWGLQRCSQTALECKGRHYFVSNEEQSEWQEKGAAFDSQNELKVLDAISKREHILDEIRVMAEECRKNFETHLSGFVQVSDVAPLLKLMDQLRSVSVRVIEAISLWRQSKQSNNRKSKPGSRRGHRQADDGSWIVKLGYLSHQLYPGSKGFKSKVKRFNRDADHAGKKAVEFRMLGIYKTRSEALYAYEYEIKRLAVERMSSLDSFPKPKFVVRSCGKHFAVESDMGVPDTRCEICFVREFNEFNSFTNPYFWNGNNYLLKMLNDSNFLNNIPLLQLFFKSQFEQGTLTFVHNPLVLAKSILDGSQLKLTTSSGEPFQRLRMNAVKVAARFGVPTEAVLVHGPRGATIEWFGHVSASKNRVVKVGENLAYISELVHSRAKVKEFLKENDGLRLEIMDMKRIRGAQRVLDAEEKLHTYMFRSKLETKREKIKMDIEMERLQRREERESRRKLGEEVDTSEDDTNTDNESDDEFPIVGDDVLTADEFLDLTGTDSSDYRDKPLKNRTGGKTMAELLPIDRQHTSYYWDRGEYIAIQQPRHEQIGKIKGKWATGEPGTTFEGMELRGKHSKHFKFQKDLELKGKALMARRERFIRRLKRSLKRKDKCNPTTISTLIGIGKELGGSLVEMDCRTAEKFLENWRRRTSAAIKIQRVYRGHKARLDCRTLRQQIYAKTSFHLRRDRAAHSAAKKWSSSLFKRCAVRAKRRLKKPIATCVSDCDGEPLIMSLHQSAEMRIRFRVGDSDLMLLEKCFACQGKSPRSIPRRDLTWMSMRGNPCVPNRLDISELGVAKLHRIFEHTNGGGPCFCRRAVPAMQTLIIKAYNPNTSQTYFASFDIRNLQILQDNRNGKTAFLEQFMIQSICERTKPLFLFDTLSVQQQTSLNEDAIFTPSFQFSALNALPALWSLRREFGHYITFLEELRLFGRQIEAKFHQWEEIVAFRRVNLEDAESGFKRSHAILLAAQIHKHAMAKACDTAMLFSKRQIELYEDLTLSTNQQAWEPKENANDAIFIQRKWQAAKAVSLAKSRRDFARANLFMSEQNLQVALFELETIKEKRESLVEAIKKIEIYFADLQKLYQAFESDVKAGLVSNLKENYTLRNGRQRRGGVARRELVVNRFPGQNTNEESDLNVLFRRGRTIFSPYFLDHELVSQLGIVSVFEQAKSSTSTCAAPKLPPPWISSAFTWSKECKSVRAFDPYMDQKGYPFQDAARPTLKNVLKMLVSDAEEWSRDVVKQWEMGFTLSDAVAQPPYMGIIHLSIYFPDQCEELEWVLDPIELRELLCTAHYGIPGEPCSHVFTLQYVKTKMQSVNRKHFFGGYDRIRGAMRELRLEVVSRLVELLHIGVYDGLPRLGKLEYFRIRRQLFPEIFKTQWWKDISQGRSILKGVKIYEGVHLVAQASAVVAVFENYGDLAIEVAWVGRRSHRENRSTGKRKFSFPSQSRVWISDEWIRHALTISGNFELLQLWKQCVLCCKYPAVVIEDILKRLILVAHDEGRRGLCLNKAGQKIYDTPYTGLRVERRPLHGIFFRTRKEFTDCHDPNQDNSFIGFDSEAAPALRLVADERDLFELVHREVLFISGETYIVSGRISKIGDIWIDAIGHSRETLSLRMSKFHVRNLARSLNLLPLLAPSNHNKLFAVLFSLLAVRSAPAPHIVTRDHPLFRRYCKMIEVGIPKGAVLHAIKLALIPESPHFGDLTNVDLGSFLFVLFESDFSLPPPKMFRLPRKKVKFLILSQARPEEHFRRIYRGPFLSANNVNCRMEVLERNRNLWLRIRRETETETDLRVMRRELQHMDMEDSLAQRCEARSIQIALQKEERASAIRSKEEDYESRKDMALRWQIRQRNKTKRRLDNFAQFVASLTELVVVEKGRGISFLELNKEAVKDCDQSSHPDFDFVLRKEVLRLKCLSTGSMTIPAIISIRGQDKYPGSVLVEVYTPSDGLTFRKMVEFEHRDAERENLVWEMAISNELSTHFERCEKQRLGPYVSLRRKAVCDGHLDRARFIQMFWCRALGMFGMEVHRLGASTFYLHEMKEPFQIMPKQSTDVSKTDQDFSLQGLELSNDLGVVYESCDESEDLDDSIWYKEEDSDGNAEHEEFSRDSDTARVMLAAEQKYLGPGNESDRWETKVKTLERLESFYLKENSVDKLLLELYSSGEKFVGDGPTEGGARKEKDPGASSVMKHSIMLNNKAIDILCSQLGSMKDEHAFLKGSGWLESLPRTKELLAWLQTRVHFSLGENRKGENDHSELNRTILTEGITFRSELSGDCAGLCGGVANARLSNDDSRIYLDVYLPTLRRSTETRTLSVSSKDSATVRDLVSLSQREPTLIGKLREEKPSILDPRNAYTLCKDVLRRSVLVRFGNGVIRLIDFDSQARQIIREQKKQLQAEKGTIERALECELSNIVQLEQKKIIERLENERQIYFSCRARRERERITVAVSEWEGMYQADTHAQLMRPYLCADSKMLAVIDSAFSLCDKDGDGNVDKEEFRSLLMEVGNVLTDMEAERAMNEMDLDNNGFIDRYEFAMWWIKSHREIKSRRMAKAKLKLRAVMALGKFRQQSKPNALNLENLRKPSVDTNEDLNSPPKPPNERLLNAIISKLSNPSK